MSDHADPERDAAAEAYPVLRRRFEELIAGELGGDPRSAMAAADKILFDITNPAHRSEMVAWLAAGGWDVKESRG